MIKALEDEGSRGLVRLGIMLAQMEDFLLGVSWTGAAASEQVKAPSKMQLSETNPYAITDIMTDGINEKLDKVQEQLENVLIHSRSW